VSALRELGYPVDPHIVRQALDQQLTHGHTTHDSS
jgi:hypothetical protein